MSGSQDEIPPPPPPPPPSTSQTPTQQTPHTVSTIKLPILKKGEYDIWAMKMEHYLAHTDYPIWKFITNEKWSCINQQLHRSKSRFCLQGTAEEILPEKEKESLNHFAYGFPEEFILFGGNDDLKEDAEYILKQSLKILCVSMRKHIMFRLSSSNPSGQNSQYEQTSSYSLLANQSSCPQLDHEDLEQLDEYDLEEMDLKWQVAMISMRMKKFYKKTGRKLQFDAKEPVGFDKTKVECYNCHKTGHFARECRNKGNQDSRRRDAWNSGNKDGRRSGKQEDSNALVTIDGEGVDWTSHSEEEDYALMACNSSGSDTEVTSCSNECKESYAKLKKLYDAQREQLSDASIEIKAYTQGLKKVEAQLVAHQQGQLWYEEKIKFMKIDLDDKIDVLTYHKKLLAEAQKEKDDLKAKVEKWHNSSKNLGKLLNSQMSAHDKFGLGYGDHRYDGILSYENEVLQSVFMGKESDFENLPLYDKFVKAGEMHAVPPPMTGNYMPFGPDINSEDEYESLPTKEQETPSFANQQVKSPRETVKNHFTHSKNPKVDKKELGYGFTARACFVCGSLNHLIRDCDFHEKRMAKQVVLNNRLKRNSSQREIRPIWNNVQRVNNQNQFVPTAVLTRTGKIPVNTASSTKNISTARHNFNRQAVLTNVAMKVNTVKPIVNRVRPTTVFHKTHSPFSRPLNNTTAFRTNFSKQKVNTAKVNTVSAVGRKRETAVKPSAGCNWRPQRHHNWHKVSKYNGVIPVLEQCVTVSNDPLSRRKPKQGPGHMTGNKAYLAEYQDFNGGPVAFGGSKCYITGKGGLACLIAKATIDESNKWHRRIKRQEKDANDAAEALKKEFAQETKNLLIQVGAAKASISTASPYDGLSLSDPTNPEQDDSEIPALEDIYQNPTDGIFTNLSYDDEGVVVDFTNLESVVNVSPIPTSRIHSIHPSTLILGDPKSAVQIRSKVTKSSGSHAFKISEALEDESWVDAMQEELLQFKIQKVWILVDLPYGKKAIGTKLGFLNKKDERGVVNGYRRGTIDKTLFLRRTNMIFILVQVYVDDIIFGSTKKSWCDEFEALMKSRFQMSSMGELTFFLGLQVKQKADGIFISQDKYVAEILMKLTLYSMFQVTPKTSHLSAVKRIFRYLKGKPKLGLWYPRVPSFDLEAYSDSDYVGPNLDRKSTTGDMVAAASCCGASFGGIQTIVDYGFNFMNTQGSTLIMNALSMLCNKNPVYHLPKTKHIDIMHHFIWDAYEKKLISHSLGFRESLGRALDGTEALMLPKLFILWLATVLYRQCQELVPLGKDNHGRISSEGRWECLSFMRTIDFLRRKVPVIHVHLAGKPVSISEASIRSDLLFNDADGIDSLPNQAIFDAI
ncbi:ribonuclease H-like domain-containing protein [Tanacetum coccineum]